MVAAARALASAEPDALINDPFAAPLVRAVGVEFFTKMVDGSLQVPEEAAEAATAMTTVMAVRTRFFDDFFIHSGLPQAVILASGLDSRAYRLPWAPGAVVYEIDQPEVIDFKTRTLAELGAEPTTDRRTVSVDLRDDWPAALRGAGFDDSVPTAWSAEGLLIYLPPEAQDRLFDHITTLSAPGSTLATEYHRDAGAAIGQRAAEIRRQWGDQGFDLDFADLSYPGERHPVTDYLSARGWDVTARSRPDVFADYGQCFPTSEALAPLRNSLSVIATRSA
ncbi:SAM-dependent methyltransferase [Mycobacterium sp. MS1601]|uniref:SAM-dependent methyltransferase n=1 Tax=Mycobacterium sp. MS1601 TaxID=1936029 RepID=UPI0009796309|nr:class I SAM-dependent methyltransferase [Mycobacterium sp. MS1601]AQA06115.1 SAM-dependent methyltransferase [Mycobacterium sp. MS1601]